MGADEPAAQATPAFAPGLLALGERVSLRLLVAGRRVARLALRGRPQQWIDARMQQGNVLRDRTGAPDEVADEALEVVDQALLVGQHRARIGLLQLDAACQAGHEGLGVVGEALEHAHQIAQGFVQLGRVQRRRVGQREQGLEPARDVFERHRL